MKGPYPECEFCECTNEGSETLGCAAEKLRKAALDLADELLAPMRKAPRKELRCRFFVTSIYARRNEKMTELGALLGKEFAQECCELIRAEKYPYGYEFEHELRESAIGWAREGKSAKRIKCMLEAEIYKCVVLDM